MAASWVVRFESRDDTHANRELGSEGVSAWESEEMVG